VIVIIPAHNQEPSTGEVVRRIPRDFDRCKAKALAIDDGSTTRLRKSKTFRTVWDSPECGVGGCVEKET